jgi:hypothetical protein
MTTPTTTMIKNVMRLLYRMLSLSIGTNYGVPGTVRSLSPPSGLHKLQRSFSLRYELESEQCILLIFQNPINMKQSLGLVLMTLPVLVLGFVGGKNRLQRSAPKSTVLSSGSSNPFTSMIGDMASSIFGNADSIEANGNVESKLSTVGTGTWADVKEKLKSVQTPEERAFRENLSKGYGVGSPLHLVRLYDESNREEDVRVTFYRDSASWCK